MLYYTSALQRWGMCRQGMQAGAAVGNTCLHVLPPLSHDGQLQGGIAAGQQGLPGRARARRRQQLRGCDCPELAAPLCAHLNCLHPCLFRMHTC